MAGIQTRGRGRITTNKINQLKIQQQNNINNQEHLDKISSNKNYHHNPVSDQQLLEHKDDQGNYYQPYYESPVRNRYHTVSHEQIESHPIPTSGKFDQDVQAEVYGTESVIKKAELVERHGHGRFKKIETKPRTMGDPVSNIFLGMGNTVQDYAGIVQGGYEDKSILNQSITKAIEGDWAGAGKLIQDNPYRFTGNLIVEAGSALIPVGAVLKVAKVAKVTNKIATTLKNTKDKIIPTKTVYKIVQPSQGKTFWAGSTTKSFYMDKVLHANYKEGMPQLRSIDIPKSTPNIEELIHTSGVYNPDTGNFVPRSFLYGGLKQSDNYNPTPVRDTKFPGKAPLSDYISVPKEPGIGQDMAIIAKQEGKKTQIGKEVYQDSRDWKNEYAIKADLQAKEKVVATLGEKESLIQRIIHPWYSDDKFANAISKTPNLKNSEEYISFFSPWGKNIGRGGVNYTHQGKPQNITFHKAKEIAKKREKTKQALTAGLITGGTLSFTSKNNAIQKGKEGQSMYKIKSAIAEEWDNPETRPGQWQNTTRYFYNKPGSPDTPYGDAITEGQDWAKSFWDTTPPRDERTWQQERPSIFWT